MAVCAQGARPPVRAARASGGGLSRRACYGRAVRWLTALLLGVCALAFPLSGLAAPSTPIGTGARSCELERGADCRGVVQRWTVEHHGDLRNARFTRADLSGADFRGADLRGADFRGATLRHADFREAKLKGARFDAPPKGGKRTRQTPSCSPDCQGADLTDADLSGALLQQANLSYATLDGADMYSAQLPGVTASWASWVGTNLERFFGGAGTFTNGNFTGANLSYSAIPYANFNYSNFTNATLLGATDENGTATLEYAVWSNTTCPPGNVSNVGC